METRATRAGLMVAMIGVLVSASACGSATAAAPAATGPVASAGEVLRVTVAARPATTVATVDARSAAPGEFRLSPGNRTPLGITVPVRTVHDPAPAPGEFRLSPGNRTPLGITVPLKAVHDPAPAPGEFRLSPGDLPPVGVAVSLDR